MSSTKRAPPTQTSDKKKLKAKKLRLSSGEAGMEGEIEDGGLFEESAEGSHMDDEIQVAPTPKGSWDWNRCFVFDCRRNSDRYLKDMKDRNIVSIHTCASHRTMQEKAKKSFKGREEQVPCHICFGMNFASCNNETFACGSVPGFVDNFLICRTCRMIQDRIIAECAEGIKMDNKLKARNYHIADAQEVKKNLWEKLTANITKYDLEFIPGPSVLPTEGDELEADVVEEDDGDKSEEKMQSSSSRKVTNPSTPSNPPPASVSGIPSSNSGPLSSAPGVSSPIRRSNSSAANASPSNNKLRHASSLATTTTGGLPAGSSGHGTRMSAAPDPERESSLRDLIILAIEANWPELRRIPNSNSSSKIKITMPNVLGGGGGGGGGSFTGGTFVSPTTPSPLLLKQKEEESIGSDIGPDEEMA